MVKPARVLRGSRFMAIATQPVNAWSKPLVKWSELNYAGILISMQMLVTAPLLLSPSGPFSGKTPQQVFLWLFWNGLAVAVAFTWGTFQWVRYRKYARWTIACDDYGVSIVTHKNKKFQLPWTNFKGYVVARVPRKLIKLKSLDGGADFDVPCPGLQPAFDAVNSLCRSMDEHLPSGGVRKGKDEAAFRLPRWLSWTILVVSLPLLGVPVWVLALNGFAATPAILVEVLNRFGGLVWLGIFIFPLLFFVAVANLVEGRAERSRDSKILADVGDIVAYYPAHIATIRTIRVVQWGLVMFVAFAIAVSGGVIQLGTGAIIAFAVLYNLAALNDLSSAKSRAILTSTHLIVRQGKREWLWPHGTYAMENQVVAEKTLNRVRKVVVSRDGTSLALFEQWADGDWLSRAIERCGKRVRE